MDWTSYTDGLAALFEQGGVILWAILVASIYMWILLVERYWFHWNQLPLLRKRLYEDWLQQTTRLPPNQTFRRIEVLVNHRPREITGDGKVDGLRVESEVNGESRLLDVDGVFIEIGLTPNAGFARDLLGANSRGEIEADARGHTGVEGDFAAGDVTDNPAKQIVVAAGSGANAALGAFEYLVGRA